MSDEPDGALKVIGQHAQTINDRDAEAYRATVNFPFTYQNYNGVALTIEDAADLGVAEPWPWEIIEKTHPAWSHSEFEPFDVVAQSVSSVVFKILFRRVDKDGTSDGPFAAIWIATQKDGKWGVQFRHNLGRVV